MRDLYLYEATIRISDAEAFTMNFCTFSAAREFIGLMAEDSRVAVASITTNGVILYDDPLEALADAEAMLPESKED